MPLSDDFLHEQLRLLGHPDSEKIAIGMQAAVFRLGDDTIGKIWFHAGEQELRRLGMLFEALDGRLPYRTPRILEIHRPGPYWVTIETELPGVPLQAVAPPFGSPDWERARDAVIEVLGAIAQVEAPPVLRQLTVLDESRPFRPAGVSWTVALTDLVRRRVGRFGDQLRTVVDDFDTRIERLLTLLAQVKEPEPRLVHGDVTAGNILVDDDLRPMTLLDFGLLTMPGDPTFDAAAAGSLHDLWSPRIREVEAAFDTALASRLDYDPEQLLIYRCIHSLLVSNAHDHDPYGRDSGVPLTGSLFASAPVVALLN
jgi:aminoglycoside phosphotransferase (APT) family kinase protein